MALMWGLSKNLEKASENPFHPVVSTHLPDINIISIFIIIYLSIYLYTYIYICGRDLWGLFRSVCLGMPHAVRDVCLGGMIRGNDSRTLV